MKALNFLLKTFLRLDKLMGSVLTKDDCDLSRRMQYQKGNNETSAFALQRAIKQEESHHKLACIVFSFPAAVS